MGNNSLPESIIVVSCVLNVPLMLISTIGNTLVLVAILRTPSLRSPSIIFLSCLAVSDLLVGIVVQPVYVANILTDGSLQQAVNITVFSICGASLLAITIISLDRFLALHYHMRYPSLMTFPRALYASTTIWFVCFLLSLISFWSKSLYFIFIAFIIVTCILISTVCYIRIFCIVRQHQIQIDTQQQAMESLNTEYNQNMQRSKKNAINTFIYYIVMILCYIPAFIGISIYVISLNHWTEEWILAETVSFMNSSINPFLYCWRLRELRVAVVNTARQTLCKKN